MKKLPVLLIILIGFKLFACAQTTEDHTLKVDLGINALPGRTLGSKGITLELQELTPAKLVYGIRLQLIYAGQGHDYLPACVTGSYYFGGTEPEKAFKIFVGGGAGVYAQATPKNIRGAATTINFGFFPRAGFEVKHFRLSVEYNYTGGEINYAGIGLGYFFSPREQL